MREHEKVEKWVVYERLVGPNAGMKSVCTATEWETIQQSTPNQNQLVRDGITDETEAEKLARGTSGDEKPRAKKARQSAFQNTDERTPGT